MPKIHSVEFEGTTYPLGYRVVTQELQSLGLRNNPHILTYPVGSWLYLDEVRTGNSDFGGIWVARVPSGAKRLVSYMQEKHNISTRVFKQPWTRYCM